MAIMPEETCLTMPNMTSGLALLSSPGLSQLASHAARLPEVYDYYCGWYAGGDRGADNVLLFSRTAESLRRLSKGGRDFHHRYVLSIALAGAGEVDVDGKPLLFQPGDALLLPPFVLHRYPASQADDLIWLFLTFDHVAPRREHLSAVRYRITAEVASLLTTMIEWWLMAKGSWPDAVARRSMALAVTLLLERLAAAPGGTVIAAGANPGDAEPWLAPVLRRIGDMAKPLPTLDELARIAKLSPSRLRFRFQKRFGISLGRYSRQIRVRHAVSMVINENRTIGEAAMQCGFSSVYVFSRSAKTVLGCPPKDYIERARRGGRGMADSCG